MPYNRKLLSVLLFEKQNKIKDGIYHRLQIDFAYSSNHIEDSRLSLYNNYRRMNKFKERLT